MRACKVFPPCCWSAEEIESDSCMGVVSALFFLCHPPLGWSAAGAAIRWVRGHTVVLFWEKSSLCCQVAVVGGDSYGFVFPPRVTASAASLTPLPHPHPRLQPKPQSNGPHPKCKPCFSQSWNCMWAFVCVCVCPRFLAVFADPGQSRWLAQMWQA